MNLNEWVKNYIKEVTHSHEYEDMSQMGEDENDPQEIKVGNYQTKYFHVCPGASALYKDIESKGVDMDMAERSARLQDALYFVEEHIQRDGYKPERDYVMVANNLAKNIMKLASMMNLTDEHSYIQGHVDTIQSIVKHKGLEERIMELTEENVPTDPAKWSYYKSQAKEKFDVYPSAYANAWAAKQYKDAGGGWRTKKSEATAEEEDEFHRKLDKLVHKTFGHSSDEKKMNESKIPNAEQLHQDHKIKWIDKPFDYFDDGNVIKKGAKGRIIAPNVHHKGSFLIGMVGSKGKEVKFYAFLNKSFKLDEPLRDPTNESVSEGMVAPRQGHKYYQLTKDAPIKYIKSQSNPLGATGVLLHNKDGYFKGKKGAYVIDYYDEHFYVDLKSKFATPIYELRDQRELVKYIQPIGMAPEYNDWKKYVRDIPFTNESVNEATKYKVGQKTPVGKIIGTSVWGKGSKQEWFYDVQKPGYSPKQYSEKSLDKIMGESVNESKVHFEKKLKNGNIFQVVDRDTTGMRGTQDKFHMMIVDKKGKVVKDIGSHPSLSGAKIFSKQFESVNEANGTYFKAAYEAAEYAKEMAEKKGYQIDGDDWQTQIGFGGKYGRLRPGVGKTHSFSIGLTKNGKPQRKALNISLYGMDRGYELTYYIN